MISFNCKLQTANSKLFTFLFPLSFLFIFFFCQIPTANCQTDTADYFDQSFLRYDNYIYRSNIKTVKFENAMVEFSEPVLELNSGAQLLLKFDDLDADVKDYWYTIMHCDANWKPSEIIQSSFLSGFAQDRITNYRYSFNTIQSYTHYQLLLPNEIIKPLISGNYILKVYLNNDEDSVVITRKFLVFENLVTVNARIHGATSAEYRQQKQEVDFSISYPDYVIANPFGDLHVRVLQNFRWDNAISNLKPIFLKDKFLEYEYDEENNFNGGNEFRYFDTRPLKYETERVKAIYSNEEGTEVYLFPDKQRYQSRYSSQYDLNGKYEVKSYSGNNHDLDADYTRVHFELDYKEQVKDGNIYVFGELTNWQFSREAKMKYDETSVSYETELYLKQGYYNYQYVFVKDGTGFGDESLFEGNHYETENAYWILVYHRPVGGRYDKLIAARRFQANN